MTARFCRELCSPRRGQAVFDGGLRQAAAAPSIRNHFVGATWNSGTMRLQIHHDDEAGLKQAKGWLLDGFGRWLSDEGLVGIAASDAPIALTRHDCRPSAS